MVAVQFACMQLGKPYVWGGNGPELTELPNGQHKVTGGFDCSGRPMRQPVSRFREPRTRSTSRQCASARPNLCLVTLCFTATR
jgi:ribosomal protein S6E (S10)